jgi:thiazole synthase ThiGH ThiG subunit
MAEALEWHYAGRKAYEAKLAQQYKHAVASRPFCINK